MPQMGSGRVKRLREFYDTTDTADMMMSDPFDHERDAARPHLKSANFDDTQVSQALKLAGMIRKVDGGHNLGAYAMAEELIALGVSVPTDKEE